MKTRLNELSKMMGTAFFCLLITHPAIAQSQHDSRSTMGVSHTLIDHPDLQPEGRQPTSLRVPIEDAIKWFIRSCERIVARDAETLTEGVESTRESIQDFDVFVANISIRDRRPIGQIYGAIKEESDLFRTQNDHLLRLGEKIITEYQDIRKEGPEKLDSIAYILKVCEADLSHLGQLKSDLARRLEHKASNARNTSKQTSGDTLAIYNYIALSQGYESSIGQERNRIASIKTAFEKLHHTIVRSLDAIEPLISDLNLVPYQLDQASQLIWTTLTAIAISGHFVPLPADKLIFRENEANLGKDAKNVAAVMPDLSKELIRLFAEVLGEDVDIEPTWEQLTDEIGVYQRSFIGMATRLENFNLQFFLNRAEGRVVTLDMPYQRYDFGSDMDVVPRDMAPPHSSFELVGDTEEFDGQIYFVVVDEIDGDEHLINMATLYQALASMEQSTSDPN